MSLINKALETVSNELITEFEAFPHCEIKAIFKYQNTQS